MRWVIRVDVETRSAIDLRLAGSWAYAYDPSTELLVAAFWLLDGTLVTWHPGEPIPQQIFDHAAAGGTFSGWNAGRFERLIWRAIMVKLGFPVLRDEQWSDPAARARAVGLPGGLDGAATALRLDIEKDRFGKANMLRLSKPLRKKFFNPDDPLFDEDGVRHDLLDSYNRQDVRVEAAADALLPPLPPGERAIELLDWRINDRGVAIDLDLVDALHAITLLELADLDARMSRLTGGIVPKCSSLPRLKAWLTDQGLAFDTLRKGDLADLMGRAGTPEVARIALALRGEANKASVKKYSAMRQAVMADGRLRGMFLYHGAATGRWSGQIVQLHNLIRDQIAPNEVENVVRLALHRKIDELRELVGALGLTIMDAASRLLRPCLVAGPGKLLVPGDLSQIEARTIAWLAGQDDVVEVFRQGGDIYKVAAARIYGVPEAEVTKAQRQIGKVAVLALGYQGALGAFQTMAAAYGVHLSDDVVLEIVRAWRQAHPQIVRFWYRLEEAAMSACAQPGREFAVGRIAFRHLNGHLHMRLPSGRWLTYWGARIKEVAGRDGWLREAVVYQSAEGRGRLVDVQLYGGLLAENATQAVAADALREGLQNLELCGVDVVGHVHDEAIPEVPERLANPALVNECMTTMRPWAAGLPVACEVDEPTWRYRK
jgi:DNA polymerase